MYFFFVLTPNTFQNRHTTNVHFGPSPDLVTDDVIHEPKTRSWVANGSIVRVCPTVVKFDKHNRCICRCVLNRYIDQSLVKSTRIFDTHLKTPKRVNCVSLSIVAIFPTNCLIYKIFLTVFTVLCANHIFSKHSWAGGGRGLKKRNDHSDECGIDDHLFLHRCR